MLYKVHRRVGELAGLHSNRVRDLRHSYATIEIYEHHASMQYVSEQLEYAGITITVGTYGHRRPGSNIALADRLDAPGTQARDNAT